MNKYKFKRKILFFSKKIVLILIIISLLIFGASSVFKTSANYLIKGDLTTLKQPFTFLIMGGDNGGDRNTNPLVDTIILATINPKNERDNISVDILSIPRDTEVTFDTGKTGKINSSLMLGMENSSDIKGGVLHTVEVVENLLDTKVDFYAYTNFDGLISVIDAIGGININIPYDFCEQDSQGNANAYCFIAGEQTLNGEQALAYARQRKSVNPLKGSSGDDWERNIRQQEVLTAILKKIISNPTEYATSLLSIINSDKIIHNIDLNVLSNLLNFAVTSYNNILYTLSNQGTINILVKDSLFNHNVRLNPINNLFNLETTNQDNLLSDNYPINEAFSTYYENTVYNNILINYKNTNIPLSSEVSSDETLNIELSFNTIGTVDSDINSNQIIPDEALIYYQQMIKQAQTLKK